MSAELELFQTHRRRRLESTPRRMRGWYMRAQGLAEPPTTSRVVHLDRYRVSEREPLLRTPNWMGGYPPVQARIETEQDKIAEALLWHGSCQQSWDREPNTGLKCTWVTEDHGATILAFPFNPWAVLRNPRMRLAPP